MQIFWGITFLYISLLCNFERKVMFDFVWNEHAHTMHLHDETIFAGLNFY